jgi:hypothetical protein
MNQLLRQAIDSACRRRWLEAGPRERVTATGILRRALADPAALQRGLPQPADQGPPADFDAALRQMAATVPALVPRRRTTWPRAVPMCRSAGRDDGERLDLDEQIVANQAGHLYESRGGLDPSRQGLFADCSDYANLTHVAHKVAELDDVFPGCVGSGKRSAEIGEHLAGLNAQVPGAHEFSVNVERDLTAENDQSSRDVCGHRVAIAGTGRYAGGVDLADAGSGTQPIAHAVRLTVLAKVHGAL